MRDDLETLAQEARDGMLAKSEKARWAGVNAEVTRGFVDKTAKEFGDLAGEADSIYSTLSDVRAELAAHQSAVKGVVREAHEASFREQDNGDGTVSFHYAGDTPRGAILPEDQQALNEQGRGYAKRVNPHIEKAAGLDIDIKRALKKAHGGDAYNAGHAEYSSLNEAQAERAAELAEKGDEMSPKELSELNRLLEQNGREKNGEFATRVYEKLGGPEKALEFYAQMSVQGTGDDASATRLDAVQQLQRNMGHTLANATEPDAPQGLDGRKYHLPASWGEEFRRLGTQPIEWQRGMTNRPYGYQVLGGLLRYGNYDPGFLNPIAEHVTQLHRDDPGRFLTNSPAGSDDRYGFNPSGKLGSGNDPLNSVLEALGHSPDAAEKFFTEPPTKYNENGTVDQGGDAGFASYLDEFTKEDFHWNIDRNAFNLVGHPDAEQALNEGPKALGHALEAATTGRPYDSDASADAVRHTPERAELAQEVVERFGNNPELIRHNENGDLDEESGPLHAMRGSLGDIAAEYIGDFQRTVSGEEVSSDVFPSFGEEAEFKSGDAVRFLAEVGQDPDAYGSITAAQQAYTRDVVDGVINGDSESNVDLGERVRAATEPGGVVAGIMSEARADAVLDYHAASDQEFNDAADEKQKWVDRILSMGTDQVAERVPIAGDVIGWVSEDIQSSVMDSVYRDSSDQAEGEANRQYTEGLDAARDSASNAVSNATLNSDLNYDTIDDLKRSARSGAQSGHTAGSAWESAGDSS
ncbi:DUF6571 family protein [Streptomyces xiaopingdaonensis]|uniref:DUF6571 family protein n=1 Tax=Streptomyces xiaopingdaonensis TaxID=1565415 RepID=UPI001ED958B0|nr:DUF6571 family protein [Streptomyces xiaopingdaonensis]